MSDVKVIAEYELYDKRFPKSYVGDEVKRSVLDYLRSFEPCYRTASPVFDPVSEFWTDIPLEAFTDGVWGWDTNDIYLFDLYGLKLDDEFVQLHS